MRSHHPQQAKILSHADGLGTPHTDLVRERASEIAQIDGRLAPNQQDWRKAKIELHGGHSFNTDNDEDEMAVAASERDMIAGGLGHQTPRHGFDGEDHVIEELVAEGIDEAVHEQMLEASRRDRDELEETP